MKVKTPALGPAGRMKLILKITLKICIALLSLYLFICSLTFLSISFRILGGRNLSSLFSDNDLLSNPIVGVMIGILVTVLVQSSTTSTSIIVSLVSAGTEVKYAIPMIMGSNVGTSVTNTIVSMTQANDKKIFERAFAAATVHDMFNWMTVIILTGLELSTGFLEKLTQIIVDSMPLDSDVSSPDILKPLTKPFTSRIVQIDKKVLLGWSFAEPAYENITTILLKDCGNSSCSYLLNFMGESGWGLNDTILGIFLLIFSLSLLIGCLLVLMKILNSLLGTSMAIVIQRVINADIPYVPWLTGYIAMLIGAIITILVRSSSIFTSTLTPLCGTGLVTLETAYPMTLGSNIGTTTTAILASFAAEGKYLKPSIQISFVHLFFNIIGILIFYPIPFMRWPIPLAKMLGRLTSNYRWFAGAYLIFMFFILPVTVFVLSIAGQTAFYFIVFPVMGLLTIVIIINVIQSKKPQWLPKKLQNWHFLPLYMRSLEPYDRLLTSNPCCQLCCAKCLKNNDPEEGNNYPDDRGNKSINDLENDEHERLYMAESTLTHPNILNTNGINSISSAGPTIVTTSTPITSKSNGKNTQESQKNG